MIYLLFTYDQYYPGGGMSDCRGIYSTLREAKDAFNSNKDARDYVEIVEIDGASHRVVADYDYRGWSDEIAAVGRQAVADA